jgi:hypothetical protein
MDQITPPTISPTNPKKNSVLRTTITVLVVIFFLFVLAPALIFTAMTFWMLKPAKEFGELHIKSYTDQFNVTVLELKSESNYFEEKVRVRCEEDMTAGIWITDLKKVGLFETKGFDGRVYYKDGDPHLAGSSTPVGADGKYSTCEILFRLTPTPTGITWHDEESYKEGGSETSGSTTTILSIPLQIKDVQTNWPNSYERGSEVPLANLGDYKILLSVK